MHKFFRIGVGALVCLSFSFCCLGQITTASIKGTVSDDSELTLIGATILALHQPTGIEFGTTTQDNGNFIFPNLKVGGPYMIKVSYTGFENHTEENIYLTLGESKKIKFNLKPVTQVLGEVVVTHKKNSSNNDSQGTQTNIGKEKIQTLPSLNRSIQDITRLTPQGGVNSFAGTNYRFNNLSIDGASNNDVLGFQEPASGAGGSIASGTPGALAGTQPISLDAIQEVQISIAPFDVRQGNFTGANLNAVTRSGTNNLEGSIYMFGRNQNLAGKSVDETKSKLENFHDYQIGFRFGGALKKNKLFGFINYELSRRSEPVLNVPGSSSSNIPKDVASSIQEFLIGEYNYDPGSFEATNIERVSDKLFVRFDYNISKDHQLAVRHNFVDASADRLERGERILNFSSQGFTHHSRTHSTVAELRSRFGENIANHLVIGHNNTEDHRTYSGNVFPHIEINYNTANNIFLGTYREAAIYGATINSTQFNNDLSFYKGKHILTIGTNNEFYHLQYRFLTAWNGRWAYRSLNDFFENKPSRIRGVYNLTNNDFEYNRNRPSADLWVFLLSTYIQDEIQINDRFTLSAGLRFDIQVQPDDIPLSTEFTNTPNFSHFNHNIGGKPQINPRIGFNWQINTEKSSQLRGGLGTYTGRIPFVWYGYAEYISGIEYGNIDIRPNGEVFSIEDDLSQLQNLQPGLTEINVVDNNFKLPRNFRTSIAFDHKFESGLSLTLEGVYSKVLQAVSFQSLNLKNETASFSGADNRSYYILSGANKKVNPNFTNVFLLTNTTKGYQYNLTVQILQQIHEDLNVSTAYTYGQSKDIANGVRSSMAANFNWNQSVDSNNPDLAYSNFDLRHRFLMIADWACDWNEKQTSYISAFFSAQSGSPFSYTIAGDLNKDGSSRNDLVYVPATREEIVLKDIYDENGQVAVSADEQWIQLNSFIQNEDYLSSRRGRYAERNGGRTPWNYQMDIRLAHRLKVFKKNTLEINLDIFSLTNLLNKNWGHQFFVPNLTNSSFQLLELEGIENGEPTYQFKNPGVTPWQTDQLASRWQAQLGIRLGF